MMKIVVVGGGSAAWITASYLHENLDCDLTVIHDDKDAIIGVGESTTPAIRKVITNLPDWKNKAKAIPKYGIRFRHWYEKEHEWYHLFEDAIIKDDGVDSIDFLRKNQPKIDTTAFNYYHGNYIDKCKNNLLDAKNDAIPGYGYHVQADKLGLALKEQMRDYTEIKSKVVDVKLNDDGIEYLLLNDGRKIIADYFFDCTGFKRVLISKLTVWQSYTDMIGDRYISGPVERKGKIQPYTMSNAYKNGWRWEIDTQDKRNAGYVYCSHLMSDGKAIQESGLNYEPLSFDSGRMKHVAIKNCISNGLAQSFIEPLEATSIMLTCSTVEKFVEITKRKLRIETFNKWVCRFINWNKEFVRYHYVLSQRRDSEWWEYWGSLPNHIEDFLQSALKQKRYCGRNDTVVNHYNIAALMVANKCFDPALIK